ncbi:hypothetical protein BDV19DRAFT_393328 [Aspergillus venezuelensis]
MFSISQIRSVKLRSIKLRPVKYRIDVVKSLRLPIVALHGLHDYLKSRGPDPVYTLSWSFCRTDPTSVMDKVQGYVQCLQANGCEFFKIVRSCKGSTQECRLDIMIQHPDVRRIQERFQGCLNQDPAHSGGAAQFLGTTMVRTRVVLLEFQDAIERGSPECNGLSQISLSRGWKRWRSVQRGSERDCLQEDEARLQCRGSSPSDPVWLCVKSAEWLKPTGAGVAG